MIAFIALATLAAANPAAAPQQRAAIEQAADPQDKVICKRFIETGSLVRGYQSCKAKREWEREGQEARDLHPAAGAMNSCVSHGAGAPC
ncbi:MAG: hypothetical protein M3Y27_05000 [Acidobacteriota bacterium]|nr:hypothetical protein [Acidobacteriota bacterium]